MIHTRQNLVYVWSDSLLALIILEGRVSSVGSDSLRAGRSGDRIPVGARFSSPVQTGPEAHPASYTRGIGSFPGVKRSERGVDHPPSSRAEFKERIQLYLCPPLGLRGLLYGDLYLYLIIIKQFPTF